MKNKAMIKPENDKTPNPNELAPRKIINADGTKTRKENVPPMNKFFIKVRGVTKTDMKLFFLNFRRLCSTPLHAASSA